MPTFWSRGRFCRMVAMASALREWLATAEGRGAERAILGGAPCPSAPAPIPAQPRGRRRCRWARIDRVARPWSQHVFPDHTFDVRPDRPHFRIWPKRLPHAVIAPETSPWVNLDISAIRYPDKPAYLFCGRAMTYRELRAQA